MAAVVFSEGNFHHVFSSPLGALLSRSPSLLNTVDETTKGLPVVGGVTSPLIKTVRGVTDGLPIVRFIFASLCPILLPRQNFVADGEINRLALVVLARQGKDAQIYNRKLRHRNEF
jgi:hypothetical protein